MIRTAREELCSYNSDGSRGNFLVVIRTDSSSSGGNFLVIIRMDQGELSGCDSFGRLGRNFLVVVRTAQLLYANCSMQVALRKLL